MNRAAVRRRLGCAARALAAIGVCSVSLCATALDVQRVARSLKEQPTVFTRAAVPASEWRRVAGDSIVEASSPPTRFDRAKPLDSVFRAAEVLPERTSVTQQLLTELNARQTAEHAIVIDLPADVLFDFDKAALRPDATSSLDKAAELLRSYPDAPVAIDGHTDSKGTHAYNDALSLRRAEAVSEALDAGTRRFTTHGWGKRRPVVANQRPDGSDDPIGRQRNRRVEIRILPL